MSREELTNVEIALYALYLLGGTKKKVFTEDIAKKSFELAQTAFCWRRYPEYPDIEPARKALMDARNQRHLISGRAGEATSLKSSDGWIFSPEGILWLEKNKTHIINSIGKKEQSTNRIELFRKLNDLESSIAYKKFLKDNTCSGIKLYEFTDFLNVNLDTPSSIIRDRIDTIRVIAATWKRNKLLNFVNQCKKQFVNLLNT